LNNQKESSAGIIKVEDIKGFVLFTSGKEDASWPSYEMCNQMIDRLERNDFQLPYAHLAFKGGHSSSSHWPEIFTFLDKQLVKEQNDK